MFTYMLNLFLIGISAGIIASGLAIGFIEITNYRGILGWLRHNIAAKLADKTDTKYLIDILKRDLNAWDQADLMNLEYYGQIAKRSRLMFFLTCKYCTGSWILLPILLYFIFGFNNQNTADLIYICLLSISSLYLILKSVK